MKVFFPSHCLSVKSGFIFGWKKDQENIFVAATVVHLPENSDLQNICEGAEQLSLSILGVWLNENHEKSFSAVLAAAKTALADELIILRLARNSNAPLLYFVGGKLRLNSSVVILYKQPSGNAFLTTGPPNVSNIKFWRPSSLGQEQKSTTELSEVLLLLNKSHNAEGSIHKLLETKNPGEAWFCGVNFFYNWVFKVFSSIFGLVSQRRKHDRPILTEIVKFLSSLSAVFLQLCTRFRQVKALCMCLDQPKSLKDEHDDSKEPKMTSDKVNKSLEKDTRVHVFPVVLFGSLLCTMVIDIVLGLLVVSWLFSNGHNMRATDFMMEKTDTVVEWLSTLLDWLKGAPAGLKLNIHLAEYLSTFFLYHIYLWQIYLNYIEPYLQVIVSLIIMSGCFGVTFLLSLVSDVLSLVTLHIYCFYVYAARLYNFQLQKLLTLAKLFTGRKWNVEKNQVDIVPYKADRLFIGTLCFTVLLFLLPTTAMYYAVFTALRLVVLFVKGIVSKAIDMMNNLPVFALITAFVRSDLIPGGVKFEFLDSSDSSGRGLTKLQRFFKGITGPLTVVCLALHNQPLPVVDLLRCQLIDRYPGLGDYNQNWPSLLGKLAKGELIYPWVKSRNFRKEAA
ncbi:hypothetical protein ACROYT_G043368 [Oculina patagonica]